MMVVLSSFRPHVIYRKVSIKNTEIFKHPLNPPLPKLENDTENNVLLSTLDI